MSRPWQLWPPQPIFVTFSVHEFLIWCALIDSALPGTVCPSDSHQPLTLPPPLHFSLSSYPPFYPSLHFLMSPSNIGRGGEIWSLGRLRWMDRRGGRTGCDACPRRDPLHDTMSPKWQTWRRIKCFKVSQAEIKPNRPLRWWTGFVAGKSHHVATMTPGLWRTGPTHVTSCN